MYTRFKIKAETLRDYLNIYRRETFPDVYSDDKDTAIV